MKARLKPKIWHGNDHWWVYYPGWIVDPASSSPVITGATVSGHDTWKQACEWLAERCQ